MSILRGKKGVGLVRSGDWRTLMDWGMVSGGFGGKGGSLETRKGLWWREVSLILGIRAGTGGTQRGGEGVGTDV